MGSPRTAIPGASSPRITRGGTVGTTAIVVAMVGSVAAGLSLFATWASTAVGDGLAVDAPGRVTTLDPTAPASGVTTPAGEAAVNLASTVGARDVAAAWPSAALVAGLGCVVVAGIAAALSLVVDEPVPFLAVAAVPGAGGLSLLVVGLANIISVDAVTRADPGFPLGLDVGAELGVSGAVLTALGATIALLCAPRAVRS